MKAKNKIALKLSVYFTISLLVFALIIGGIFIMAFRKNAITVYKDELRERAASIAQTIGNYSTDAAKYDYSPNFPQMGRSNLPDYLRNLGSIARADVWVVNPNGYVITKAQADGNEIRYQTFPQNAVEVVNKALAGKTTITENFSSVLSKTTVTVCTPIVIDNGSVIGAVLLHSPVSVTNNSVKQAVFILLGSIALAMCLAVLLSIRLSYQFTNPLRKMKKTALQMAGGDYTAKTHVSQNDEIGELAGTLDILSEKLEEAGKQSEKLEQIRREYVANISHELKTPITVIRGSLEALCDGIIKEPAMVKEYHEQMLEESKGLQRLVGDLLDLSRLQNTDFVIEASSINLAAVMSDVVRSIQPLVQKKEIALTSSQPECACVIEGDYGRVRQMLMIIAENAVKFTSMGKAIDISLRQTEAGYDLMVKDSGKGMSAEEVPFIFDRFYKSNTPDNPNGTGLGLAIAKQIALRHNADIRVESQLDKGSLFTIHFDI